MEEYFFTKSQSLKQVRKTRNQDASHAQERVTGPLMKMFQSAGFMTPTLTSHLPLKLYYSWSSVGHLGQNLPGTGLKIHLFIVWN